MLEGFKKFVVFTEGLGFTGIRHVVSAILQFLFPKCYWLGSLVPVIDVD